MSNFPQNYWVGFMNAYRTSDKNSQLIFFNKKGKKKKKEKRKEKKKRKSFELPHHWSNEFSIILLVVRVKIAIQV